MRTLSSIKVSHPLAHCEAAKAYYYAWVDTCNEYPKGNCEVCVEVLGGLHAKSKEMFQVQTGAAD
jgi:hypothetical protein